MKISDYLKKEYCILDLKSSTEEGAIREIAEALGESAGIKDKEKFINDILERERLGSTGIGNRVAIPHSPTEAVDDFVIAFGRSKEGIDFNSIDGEKANLIFLMGTNPRELDLYLKLLAKLSKLLIEEPFRKELILATTPEEIIGIFLKFESR